MHEDEILDHLDLMLESIELIEKRFSRIRLPEDFVHSFDGVTLLDAVSMRLQIIGESVRKIEKMGQDCKIPGSGFASLYAC